MTSFYGGTHNLLLGGLVPQFKAHKFKRMSLSTYYHTVKLARNFPLHVRTQLKLSFKITLIYKSQLLNLSQLTLSCKSSSDHQNPVTACTMSYWLRNLCSNLISIHLCVITWRREVSSERIGLELRIVSYEQKTPADDHSWLEKIINWLSIVLLSRLQRPWVRSPAGYIWNSPAS